MKTPNQLEPRQALFVIEYLKDLNATQAAIRAGYSPESAAESGCENLIKSNIKNAIQEQMDARAIRTLITADKVLHELYDLATTDVNEVFDKNGNIKPIKDIPIKTRKAIASVEVDEIYGLEKDTFNRRHKTQIGVTKKIRFWDKGKSLENLARHLKLLTDKTEFSGPDGSPLVPPQIIFEGNKSA